MNSYNQNEYFISVDKSEENIFKQIISEFIYTQYKYDFVSTNLYFKVYLFEDDVMMLKLTLNSIKLNIIQYNTIMIKYEISCSELYHTLFSTVRLIDYIKPKHYHKDIETGFIKIYLSEHEALHLKIIFPKLKFTIHNLKN